MSNVAAPLLPKTAPFESEQIAVLNRVLGASTADQRQWLAGFLAGYAAATGNAALPAGAPSTAAEKRTAEPLTIVYATESGNSEALALKVQNLAKKRGFKPKVLDMGDAAPSDLLKAKNLLVIAATWGEGDPPQRAEPFYRTLMAEDAPRFEGIRFSVLALGDSSYVDFCLTGKKIDARLVELGAIRVADRVDCDLDFETPADGWIETALGVLQPAEGASAEIIPFDARASSDHLAEPPTWTAKNPYAAEIIEHVNLNGRWSQKETIHLELDLGESGIAYEPGDSLAIRPQNDPDLAKAILKTTGLAGEQALEARLIDEIDITTLSKPVMEAYQKLRPHDELRELLAGDGWRSFIADRQLIDLFSTFDAKLEPGELQGLLRPLAPRSYSIASSPLAHEGEAHLLVSAVRWQSHGLQRKGVASTYIAERIEKGGTLPVFLKPNKHFRLPADNGAPVIMVGPGTGVAPFRAFLHHRQALEAKGKNWLIFGDQTYTNDFLYQLEWQQLEKDGVLSRIDVAFSRDQPEKIYVQQRMWEARQELWAWLEEGACFYICGDASRMAKDVEAVLLKIIAEVGGHEGDKARAYLDEMNRTKRYQRDVY
jgi:sulfite reductase (NADPH) flavoprotein alpha-component